MRKPLSFVLASTFSVAMAAATISAARADVKVVSKVTTTGSAGFGGGRRGGGQGGGQTAAASPTQTYTTYFQGRKARRESADGSSIVVYDRDADKIYTLDPKAKTYYEKSYTEVIGDNVAQNAGPFRTTTKLEFTEPAAGAATAIGGVAARSFGIDGSQTMTPPAGFGGQTRPQNGNTGAADPNAQNGRRRGGFGGFTGMSTGITGSISLASAAAVLPTELANMAYDRTLGLPLTEQIFDANNQLLKPLVNSIARQQAIPLGAKITMQRTIQMAPAAAGTTGNAPQTPPTIPPTTITMEVQSVEKGITLPTTLFAVPADYKKVDVPTRGFGRGNRGGGQNGQNGQGNPNGQNGQGGRRGRNRGGAGNNPAPATL